MKPQHAHLERCFIFYSNYEWWNAEYSSRITYASLTTLHIIFHQTIFVALSRIVYTMDRVISFPFNVSRKLPLLRSLSSLVIPI